MKLENLDKAYTWKPGPEGRASSVFTREYIGKAKELPDPTKPGSRTNRRVSIYRMKYVGKACRFEGLGDWVAPRSRKGTWGNPWLLTYQHNGQVVHWPVVGMQEVRELISNLADMGCTGITFVRGEWI